MKKYILLSLLVLSGSMAYATENEVKSQKAIGDVAENTLCVQKKDGDTKCHDINKLVAEKSSVKKSSIFYKYKSADGSTVYSDEPSKQKGVSSEELDFNSARMNDKMSFYTAPKIAKK